MESSESFSIIPSDHYDNLCDLYGPPSDDTIARELQNEIDSLTLNLIERDEQIQDLREEAHAHNQPWWSN